MSDETMSVTFLLQKSANWYIVHSPLGDLRFNWTQGVLTRLRGLKTKNLKREHEKERCTVINTQEKIKQGVNNKNDQDTLYQ